MTRYDIYTALIGVISVFFSLAVFFGGLPVYVKFFLIILGAGIFFHSAYTLYKASLDKFETKKFFESAKISQISLLNKNGEIISSWELYGKNSAVIGKDIGENHVDINLSETPYAAMIDVEHAVLNYAGGNWYIEDIDSQNGISIQKAGQEKSYKLSSSQPCKLDFGDIIFLGVCRLKLN